MSGVSLKNLVNGACVTDRHGDVWVRCAGGAVCVRPASDPACSALSVRNADIDDMQQALGPFDLIGVRKAARPAAEDEEEP